MSPVLYRPPVADPHRCDPPMHCPEYKFAENDGDALHMAAPKFVGWRDHLGEHDGCLGAEAAEPIGTVWQCGTCFTFWTVWQRSAARGYAAAQPEWRHSTRRERRRALKALPL